MDKFIYLNEGMGDPCAGQSNPIFSPVARLKDKVSVSRENFGFAPPIGSKHLQNNILGKFYAKIKKWEVRVLGKATHWIS